MEEGWGMYKYIVEDETRREINQDTGVKMDTR